MWVSKPAQLPEGIRDSEAGLMDAPFPSSLGTVVDLRRENLGQEGQIGEPVALGDLCQSDSLGPHRRKVQLAGCGPDGGLGGGVGHGRHELASSRVS